MDMGCTAHGFEDVTPSCLSGRSFRDPLFSVFLVVGIGCGSSFGECVVMQGHKKSFMTVNMTAEFSSMRAELLHVAVRTEFKQHQE